MEFEIEEICREIYEGETLSIQVLDRDGVRAIRHSQPYCVISITDPEKRHASLKEDPNRTGTLLLKCNDVAESSARIKSVAQSLGAFSDAMANEVTQFVRERMTAGTRLFVINCEAGVSRSAGIASALSWHFNHDESFFIVHYKPNQWIRKQLLKALSSDSVNPS